MSDKDLELKLSIFKNKKFQDELNNIIPNQCANCHSTENLSYYHIIPLELGGTNNTSNIVRLCPTCYDKINNTVSKGRRIKSKASKLTPSAIAILDKYYALEIGTTKAKELLGISPKTKNTWYNLKKEYEAKFNIPKGFKNNIDIKSSQKRKESTLSKNINNPNYTERYNDYVEEVLHDYFNNIIGTKKMKEKLCMGYKSYPKRLDIFMSIYRDKFNIPADFKNTVDIDTGQEERLKTLNNKQDKNKN